MRRWRAIDDGSDSKSGRTDSKLGKGRVVFFPLFTWSERIVKRLIFLHGGSRIDTARVVDYGSVSDGFTSPRMRTDRRDNVGHEQTVSCAAAPAVGKVQSGVCVCPSFE
jgi:hypothetical protein